MPASGLLQAPAATVSIRARLCSRAMPRLWRRARPATGFQSAPGFAAGRCTRLTCRFTCRSSFNPRPALQPGDACRLSRSYRKLPVSIRARLCSRAMQTRHRRLSSRVTCFNPRPALQPGDAFCWPSLWPDGSRFNPRPALQPGDAVSVPAPSLARSRFNPRPALQPGDASSGVRRVGNPDTVSIRARLCSRAMRQRHIGEKRIPEVSIRARLCSRAMRNAGPGLRRGLRVSIRARLCSRAMHRYPQQRAPDAGVSIRARLCSRAMPSRSWCPKKGARSFNPRPALQPGDAVTLQEKTGRYGEFQSAPGFAAGRCEKITIHTFRATGFNPRPALQPGDAMIAHAPTCRTRSFNPRPALQPGDAPMVYQRCRPQQRFNPRPALQPGDAEDGAPGYEAGIVSIRARLCSRAMPDHGPVFGIGCQFQSAPGFAAGRCFTLATHCCQSKFFPPAANLPDGC